MQLYIQQMNTTVQRALRLSMLRLLEGLEYAAAQERAQAEEHKAAQYSHAAEEYKEKVTRDRDFANRIRHRGDYLERLGEMETAKASKLSQLAQQDDEERLALLENITALEKDENETMAALREIHEGACGWKIVGFICDAVGGATELQTRANSDYLQVHEDWKEATRLSQDEVMESMIAEMLTQKSDRYEQSAKDLWRVADRWDARAQSDFQAAQVDNAAATILWNKAQQDVKIMERDEEIEYRVDILVNHLMEQADTMRVAAYWCAVAAICCAASALVYFGGKVIPKTHEAMQILEETKDVLSLAYVGVHVLIFLATVGLAGQYLVEIERYASTQRAIILFWFATVASLVQTISLHALPWGLQQVTSPEPSGSFLNFLAESGARCIVFFFMFLLEVLLIWLTFGRGIFRNGIVNFCSSILYRLLVLAAVVAYGWKIEGPRRSNYEESIADASTLVSMSTSSWPENESVMLTHGASEATPLRKADIMSWGTTIDLAIWGGEERPFTNTLPDAENHSSIYAALFQDLRKLLLPLEILFVACMLSVLRSALHVVWISHATWIQCGVLVCAICLLLVAFFFAHEVCCEQALAESDSTIISRIKSLRSLPKFEMVQV